METDEILRAIHAHYPRQNWLVFVGPSSPRYTRYSYSRRVKRPQQPADTTCKRRTH